jgi:hypothetical protein
MMLRFMVYRTPINEFMETDRIGSKSKFLK